MKISTLEELKTFAANFLKKHPDGGAYALIGDLGAGKTTFVRNVVELIFTAEKQSSPRVTSPTYVYRQTYETKRTIEHFDLYRLENASESDLMSIGYPEALEKIHNDKGFVFIEWPEKVREQKLLHLNGTLKFTILSETAREITES